MFIKLYSFGYKNVLLNRGDKLYAKDYCGSQFESQNIFCPKLHLLFSELNDSKIKCVQNHDCVSLILL